MRRFPLVFCVVLALSMSAVPALLAQSAFRRGDANGDSRLDVSDAVSALQYLFVGGAVVACHDAVDANDDGKLDISDPIFILVHLFGFSLVASFAVAQQPGSVVLSLEQYEGMRQKTELPAPPYAYVLSLSDYQAEVQEQTLAVRSIASTSANDTAGRTNRVRLLLCPS